MLVPTQTEKAPAAIGPYSQAIRHGNLLYASGQIPLDPQTGEMIQGDIKAQTERVCQNLAGVLEASGSGFDRVIKTTCFLADMEDRVGFNEVYGKYFTSKPARSTVAVRALPLNALCEIELIAAVD